MVDLKSDNGIRREIWYISSFKIQNLNRDLIDNPLDDDCQFRAEKTQKNSLLKTNNEATHKSMNFLSKHNAPFKNIVPKYIRDV